MNPTVVIMKPNFEPCDLGHKPSQVQFEFNIKISISDAALKIKHHCMCLRFILN